jgi:hypothetical protein
MTPVELVLSRLPRAKRSGKGWVARCPAHEDRKPSLSISEGEDGRALLHCHAGCTAEAITSALQLTLADLMPERSSTPSWRPPKTQMQPRRETKTKAPRFRTADEAQAELVKQHGPCSATWDYTDEGGDLLGRIVRWDLPDGGKEIRPVRRDDTMWAIGGMPEPRPLYRLMDLADRPGERVYLVEGEKAADATAGIGLLATTSAHGSKSAAKADWAPLAGREVVIMPDNDAPGRQYAADVAAILAALTPPAKVKIIPTGPEGLNLPEGGDMVELVQRYREAGKDDAAIIRDLDALANKAADIPANGPVLTCLADVEPQDVQWLWPGRIPLGRITLLVGAPGEGKSFVSVDAAARVSTGTPWPDGESCPKGSAIFISAEDDPADTIRPRLDAHYADVRRIHLLSAVRRVEADGKSHDVMFTLADVPALEAALQQVSDCRLIVIDPIGSFLGGRTDAHRDNEVRAVLAPVAQLAAKYGAAVLVIAHRRKASGGSADELALGSRAFTGIARAVWHVSRDKDAPARRLLLPGKNNLAPEGNGLAFSIGGELFGRVIWEKDPVQLTANEALALELQQDRHKRGPEPEARNQAAEWLSELLAARPMRVGDPKAPEQGTVAHAAKEAGYLWATVRRAKDALGIKPYRDSFAGGWMWRLAKMLK